MFGRLSILAGVTLLGGSAWGQESVPVFPPETTTTISSTWGCQTKAEAKEVEHVNTNFGQKWSKTVSAKFGCDWIVKGERVLVDIDYGDVDRFVAMRVGLSDGRVLWCSPLYAFGRDWIKKHFKDAS